jgi:hypothetical protein
MKNEDAGKTCSVSKKQKRNSNSHKNFPAKQRITVYLGDGLFGARAKQKHQSNLHCVDGSSVYHLARWMDVILPAFAN